MYHVMAIANYEDRFVIPSTHREYAENTFDVRGGCGFSFGNGCSDGASETSLFGGEKQAHHPHQGGGLSHARLLREPPTHRHDPARAGAPAELSRRRRCAAICPRCARRCTPKRALPARAWPSSTR